MAKMSIIYKSIVMGLFFCITFQSCTENKFIVKGEISSIQADTTAYLIKGNAKSPTCNVIIDYMYLHPSADNDSLSHSINRILQRITFGSNYTKNSPLEAVTSVKKDLVTQYRNKLSEFYTADLKEGMHEDELPSWYNHEYNIASELKLVRDSIYNFSVTNYEYTGGAHPNTTIQWVNINANTGKELKKSDVFIEGSDKKIIQLITDHLIAEANKKLETDTITSIDGLRENGILLNVDLYVPDFFLITEEGISFLFNRYEIAPYVVGDFQLNIPYAEIENLMKIK